MRVLQGLLKGFRLEFRVLQGLGFRAYRGLGCRV